MESHGNNARSKRKKPQFAAVTTDKKQKVMDGRKAENTNKATKLWVDLFIAFLDQNSLPNIDKVTDQDLPGVIEDFYVALRSKRKLEEKESLKDFVMDTKHPKNVQDLNSAQEDDNKDCMYSISTMKSIRAALNRYFKDTRKIDITADTNFINANEIFKGLMKINKQNGRGTIVHKKPINEEDLTKFFQYFKENMSKAPNAKNLQEILLFYIIYFTGRRGRENLRTMTKKIGQDPDERKFIYQAIHESNKNHGECDNDPTTEARIYEIPGN